MSRPWKHPNSGVYWLRKAVPDDLRALVGKREEKRSLQTRDPVEAKLRHAKMLLELETRWANLRAGSKPVTEREAQALVAPAYDWWIDQHREYPSQQTFWDVSLGDRVFAPKAPMMGEMFAAKDFLEIKPGEMKVYELEAWCLAGAKDRLAAIGRIADPESHRVVAKAIAAVIQQASLTLARMAKGEVVPEWMPVASGGTVAHVRSAKPVPFEVLIKGWAAERRPAAKTLYDWRRLLLQLQQHVGHNDAARLTDIDIRSWKDAMVVSGLRSKTIQDARLAPVRALLQWGLRNKLLSLNAAEDVSLTVKSKQNEKKRSFTDEEARTILRAAMLEKDPVRRWVPWIGAYTGARVSEICQLRREDLVELEGIWCLKFAPEAGSLKTSGSERVIPLHPALVENGFLRFARGLKPGPIFSDLSPDKFGRRGGNGTKMIGRFVRQLGIVDPRLSPSHSWRHRIKTSGRKYGLAPDILNAITGHGSRSVADSYGEFPVSALARELAKIPTLKMK